MATTTNKYKYNGKEEQAEIGLYDYGARFYGATEGRWGVIDPMAEVTYSQSPFGYVGSNPVRNTDPTGMLSEEEYKKWAKEADALSSRAEQQGVGAYSALAQEGPGDKNKKAAPQQQGTRSGQASQSQTQQGEAGAGAVLVGTSALSKAGTAVEVVTEATLEGIATLGRLTMAGVGATAAVLALPFTVSGDATKSKDSEKWMALYRNVGDNELASFVRKGYNFGIGGASLEAKEFWTTPEGLEFWKTTSFTKPYTIVVNIPMSIIGPHRLVQFKELDGHLAAIVNPQNLNSFNQAKRTVAIITEK